jgi:hypothetical protein
MSENLNAVVQQGDEWSFVFGSAHVLYVYVCMRGTRKVSKNHMHCLHDIGTDKVQNEFCPVGVALCVSFGHPAKDLVLLLGCDGDDNWAIRGRSSRYRKYFQAKLKHIRLSCPL